MKNSTLKPYHYAWLEAHPYRTEEWLRERLLEGFDIHHIDCNHNNNDANNLVLIEHLDHLRIHNLPGNRLLITKQQDQPKVVKIKTVVSTVDIKHERQKRVLDSITFYD